MGSRFRVHGSGSGFGHHLRTKVQGLRLKAQDFGLISGVEGYSGRWLDDCLLFSCQGFSTKYFFACFGHEVSNSTVLSCILKKNQGLQIVTL